MENTTEIDRLRHALGPEWRPYMKAFVEAACEAHNERNCSMEALSVAMITAGVRCLVDSAGAEIAGGIVSLCLKLLREEFPDEVAAVEREIETPIESQFEVH